MPQMLETPQGRRIAYERTPGAGPGVVFLPGYRSDMTGTKAVHLEGWARRTGRAFLRFDYSGNGASPGNLLDGGPLEWAQDARAALEALTEGPQILVGSSMGGWLALAVARWCPDRVHAVVGIAAAPDFTEDVYAMLSSKAREALERDGRLLMSTDVYGGPDYLTAAQLAGAREVLILRAPYRLDAPMRLLQGTADEAVPTAKALALLGHVETLDARLTLVRGEGHRFGTPEALALMERTVEEVS